MKNAEEEKRFQNLNCPKCDQGWLARDWDDNMVCQNCGAKFDVEDLFKRIKKEGME